MTFAEQIKARRRRIGVSQSKCALILGVPAATFRGWELRSQNRAPDEFKQRAILNLLDNTPRQTGGV